MRAAPVTGSPAYSDTDDVTGDMVLEQHQIAYDPRRRVIVQASIGRYHTDTTSPTGNRNARLKRQFSKRQAALLAPG